MQKCFISYNHRDTAFVIRLADALRDTLKVWVDRRKMQPGISLLDQVATAIDVSAYVILILSKHSVRSTWVRKEIAIADTRGARLLPIRLDECQVPPQVAHLPYVDFGQLGFDDGVTVILEMIDREVISQTRFKLAKFTVWGELRVEFPDPFIAAISTLGRSKTYGGLVYDEPIFVTGYKWLVLEVDGAEKSDFTGWSMTCPRMVRVELEGRSLSSENPNDRVQDDPSYLQPRSGTFRFLIPTEVVRRGTAHQLELVLGKGHIKDLRLALRLR